MFVKAKPNGLFINEEKKDHEEWSVRISVRNAVGRDSEAGTQKHGIVRQQPEEGGEGARAGPSRQEPAIPKEEGHPAGQVRIQEFGQAAQDQ